MDQLLDNVQYDVALSSNWHLEIKIRRKLPILQTPCVTFSTELVETLEIRMKKINLSNLGPT